MQTPRGRKRRSCCQFGAGRSRVEAALSFAGEENGGLLLIYGKPGQTKEISEGERKTNPSPVFAVLRLWESDTRLTEKPHVAQLPVIEQGQCGTGGKGFSEGHFNVLHHREYANKILQNISNVHLYRVFHSRQPSSNIKNTLNYTNEVLHSWYYYIYRSIT